MIDLEDHSRSWEFPGHISLPISGMCSNSVSILYCVCVESSSKRQLVLGLLYRIHRAGVSLLVEVVTAIYFTTISLPSAQTVLTSRVDRLIADCFVQLF